MKWTDNAKQKDKPYNFIIMHCAAPHLFRHVEDFIRKNFTVGFCFFSAIGPSFMVHVGTMGFSIAACPSW